MQILFGPAYYHDHGFDTHDGHAFSLAAALISPRSRGHLRLRSADPGAKPELVGNHLAEPDDLASLVAAFHTLREIARTEPLATARGRELIPGDEMSSDDDVEAFLRREVELLYHPVGHLPDGLGRGAPSSTRSCACAASTTARRRRIGDADDHRGQHQRADDHDRREGGRPDPRSLGGVEVPVGFGSVPATLPSLRFDPGRSSSAG